MTENSHDMNVSKPVFSDKNNPSRATSAASRRRSYGGLQIGRWLSTAFVVVAAICGCGTHTGELGGDRVFEVRLKSNSGGESMRMSEIVDSISFVTLELTDRSIVGDVTDVQYRNGLYYVYDMLSSAVLMFDTDGKFVDKIARQGRGPEEYLSISAFDVNAADSTVHILDNSRTVMVYDRGGKMIRKVRNDDIVRDFAVLPNGNYLFCTPDMMKGKNRRGVWITDMNGNFMRQLVTVDEEFLCGGIYPKYFRHIDDSTVGIMGGEDNDCIYHITADSISERYVIDVDMEIPAKYRVNPVLNYNNHAGEVYTKNNYLETRRTMMFSVTDFIDNRLLIYDKAGDRLRQMNSANDLIVDMDGAWAGMMTSFPDRVIGVLRPLDVLNYEVARAKFPDLTEDSNPILVVYHM